nr:peptide methionine sulfoxide reductase MsrA isoform X3 [Misgurnus anguillicaudatus]
MAPVLKWTCLFWYAGVRTHFVVVIIIVVLQLGLCLKVAHLSEANKSALPTKERSLKGREEKMVVAAMHAANGNPTVEPFPDGMEMIMFGMGCFWGAERRFWKVPGVFSTQVGYAGGFTPNPTYQEVCSGLTGHTEVVRVVFSPKDVSLDKLLKVFWESHDPTQVCLMHEDALWLSVLSHPETEKEERKRHSCETFIKADPEDLRPHMLSPRFSFSITLTVSWQFVPK